jgi:hypothetical protein
MAFSGGVAHIKNNGSNVATKPETYFLHTDQPFRLLRSPLNDTHCPHEFRARADCGLNLG